MSDCLPCIVCGKRLENVSEDSENQASDGLSFQSHGQYGSTAFDPFDGSYLEVNICDACIVQAQLRGEVLWSRDERQVLADSSLPDVTIPEVVGYERVNRPLVSWNGDGSGDHSVDVARVDRSELGRRNGAFKNVRWNPIYTEASPVPTEEDR